jgi:hypothetical protein
MATHIILCETCAYIAARFTTDAGAAMLAKEHEVKFQAPHVVRVAAHTTTPAAAIRTGAG